MFGFTGEPHDSTGLIHLRARYYSPQHGRFLSVDPFEGMTKRPYSQHPYQYGYSNPVRFMDPTGWCAQNGDEACWGVYEQIILLCPECADLQRMTTTRERTLHEEPITYLESMLIRVRDGWRPLQNLTVEEAIRVEAGRYGVPWQIVAGVLESEIALDTEPKDYFETWVVRNFPPSAYLHPDPGPGIGNTHVNATKTVAQHFRKYYSPCNWPRLDVRENDSRPSVASRLAIDEYNVRVISAFVRQLADYRFGSNGQPALQSHADFSKWTMADAVAIWHGYRYGVPEVSYGGQGFKDIKDFQDRDVDLETLINEIVQGPGGPVASARGSIKYFEKYFK